MKLCSRISRKYKEKDYIKYWIILPNKIISELNFKKGDILDHKLVKGKLIISKRNI